MDDLVHLDADCWHAIKNMNHISLLRKNQQGDKRKMKRENWYYGCQKWQKSREVNFKLL